MQFKAVSFRDLSRIEYHLYLSVASDSYEEILLVRFTGVCGVGSSGADDAIFMRSVVVGALDAWSPFGLILDLRHLDYQWGDEMTGVLCGGDRHCGVSQLPTTVLVSNQCRTGLTSLVAQEMGEDPAHWLFDDLNSAAAELELKMRASGPDHGCESQPMEE
jgi:hypothetical protein